jgi:hypothetical protein
MLVNAVKRIAFSARNTTLRNPCHVLKKASASTLLTNISEPNARLLSSAKDDETHDDFKPKFHAAPSKDKDSVLKMIDSHVKTYPIMLYMKGTPSAPQCGFSMQVVRILHSQGVSFDSVNVLDHSEIRDGVKEYS